MIDDETENPTFYDVIQTAIDERLLEFYTCLPARVETYDASKQKATVTVVIKQAHIAEDGTRTVETLPIIVEVPVKTNGGGGYATTYPVASGDTGVVWFTTMSIDVWAAQGGIVDPLDDRRFHLSDAIFEPGVRPFNAALATAPTDRARFGKDSDGPALETTSSAVLVGGGSVGLHQPTVMMTAFMAALDVMLAAIATAVGTSGTPAGATASAAAITAAQVVFDGLASTFTTTIAKVR